MCVFGNGIGEILGSDLWEEEEEVEGVEGGRGIGIGKRGYSRDYLLLELYLLTY